MICFCFVFLYGRWGKKILGGGWDVMLVKFRQVCGFFWNSWNTGLDFSDVLVKVCACIWRACLRFLPPTPPPRSVASAPAFIPSVPGWKFWWQHEWPCWRIERQTSGFTHAGETRTKVFVVNLYSFSRNWFPTKLLTVHLIWICMSFICRRLFVPFQLFLFCFFSTLIFFSYRTIFRYLLLLCVFFCGYPDLFESVLSCVFVFLWGGRLENSVFLLLLCSVVTFLIFFPLTQIFCFLPYSVLLNALLDCQLFLLPSCFPQLFVLCGDAFIVSKTSFFFCQTHLLLSPAVWYFVW